MKRLATRLGVTSTLAGLLLGLAVVPASAHASLDVRTAPADTDIDLTIVVPLERDSTNQKVEAQLPGGFDVLSCTPTGAFLCEVASSGGGTLVTWESLAPGTQNDIAFELRVHTPSDAGERLIPVIQTYADGTEAAWIGDGGDEPAPVLEITSGSAAPEKNNAPATDHTASDDDEPTAEPAPKPEPSPTAEAAPAQNPVDDDGEQPATASDDGSAQDAGTDESNEDPAADDALDEPTDAATTEATASDDDTSQQDTTSTTTDDGAVDSTELSLTPIADDEGGSALPIIALVLLVGAGGGAAWWWRTQQQ